MIALIASEQDLNRETEILNELFEEGLCFFQVRKPGKSKEEIRDYLNKIHPKHHKNVVLHQFHELTDEFQVKGIHLQEQKRRDLNTELECYVEGYRKKGFSISSSFHETDELESCATIFNYHLLSPIFTSISKDGYEGRGFNVQNSQKKIVGMGGVNVDTIEQIRDLGFKGIGVLGGVWNTEDPVKAFKRIRDKHAEIFQG
ncbi:MAG: thiamine phosphate synthase [Crocinitomicaceae bacterium]|nr:thiamine phosphate synthase [Crocinitomicaceae bacterium]